ncbi:hypothetical protein [Cyanobacterium aponinum]|uniref:Tetratricopeptide TPR_1 repeat-containing protein n=1 Tax=Cyanobacterium aponinum 0216 TaxID=2676140 RepID=A0A844H2T8_9CHRO|nr:hypothetical protein [Cyanobacterium aponinum]MTF40655.1 hypothetical protein [Cyanobacterium aponinum 0216]
MLRLGTSFAIYVNKAILLDNNYGLAYYNRGLLYEQLGYLDKAKLDLEKGTGLLKK